MRLIVNYLLTLLLGVIVAFTLAFGIGLILPGLKIPVFVLVSVWWMWQGWKYAAAMDNQRMSDEERCDRTRRELEKLAKGR